MSRFAIGTLQPTVSNTAGSTTPSSEGFARNLERLPARSGCSCPLPALPARLLLPGAPGSLCAPRRRLLLRVGEEGVSYQGNVVCAACGPLGIAGSETGPSSLQEWCGQWDLNSVSNGVANWPGTSAGVRVDGGWV